MGPSAAWFYEGQFRLYRNIYSIVFGLDIAIFGLDMRPTASDGREVG